MAEEKRSFEEKLNRLNEIVSLIEQATLPLDENIKLYQEGKELIASMEKELSEAEEKVEKIVNINKK